MQVGPALGGGLTKKSGFQKGEKPRGKTSGEETLMGNVKTNWGFVTVRRGKSGGEKV